MGTYAKWKAPILTALIISFFACLFPFMTVHADVGEIEYEDNGLTRTENDGVGEDGDGNEDGGFLDWLDGVGDGIENAIDEAGDFFGPAVDAVGDAWDWTTDQVSDGWDWTKNAVSDGWDNFTDWTSGVWDATPDWVKSSLAFVGVAAAVVGIAVVGVISAPVAAVAIIGAGIAGGLYYAFNGGEDSYSFWGALGWTLGGALAGGVGQATGALAAGFNAARVFIGRQVASGLLSFSLNRFALGSTSRALLSMGKQLGGAWLKVGGPSAIVTFGSHVLNYGLTGQWDTGEIVFDMGLAFATAPIGFGLVKSFWNTAKTARVLAPISGSMALGGATNVAMQAFKGDATFADFLIGSAVGLTFVLPDAFVTKYVNNSGVQNTYEFIKKQLSDTFSKSLEERFKSSPNKQ